MVLMRVALLAWMGVVPVVWCLTLNAVPPPSLHRLRNQELPELPQDDLQSLMPREVNKDDPDPGSFGRYDEEVLRELEDPNSRAAYRLQKAISEAVGGPDGAMETGVPSSPAEVTGAEEGAAEDDWLHIDPRYYLLTDDYLARDDQAGPNNIDNIRKARKSRNSSSSISSTKMDNSMKKRTWPHGLSRRRNSGLSLSIDASMKVLREALYLEIARKKQRQQMQRAQHNKALLNSIGKRDVSQQLEEDRPQRDPRN